MRIGIIGVGEVGKRLARSLVGAGHDVVVASARGAAALAPTAADLGTEVAEVEQVAALDVVVLAVPWRAVADTLDPLPDWEGRILVDATNPFLSVDPPSLEDLGGRSASRIVAGHASGARVVKAFNSITMVDFAKGPGDADARRVLFLSGDDSSAKATIAQLIADIGYAAIDLGDLDVGGRMQQAGGPLAGRDFRVADQE